MHAVHTGTREPEPSIFRAVDLRKPSGRIVELWNFELEATADTTWPFRFTRELDITNELPTNESSTRPPTREPVRAEVISHWKLASDWLSFDLDALDEPSKLKMGLFKQPQITIGKCRAAMEDISQNPGPWS